MTVAKIVNSRIRQDRHNVLNGIADSEFDLPKSAVPKIAGDLSKEQMTRVDSVLTRKYGDKWFKDRRTHPSNIPSNLDLQCGIITAFYEGNVEMIRLVEIEIAKADERGGRVNADAEMLEEVFGSSDGLRAGAWAEIEGRYTLIRERLQRQLRSQKHREKKKEEKMLTWSDDGDGGSGVDEDGKSKSSKSERNKSGSSNAEPSDLREDPSIPPLKSVSVCVKDFLEVVKFVIDAKKRTVDKVSRLESLFESLADDLENRIGFRIINQDAEVCFMMGILNVILEMVPSDDNLSDRLSRLTKALCAQRSLVVDTLNLEKSRRTQIEKMLKDQRDLMGEFMKRWMDADENAVVASSAQLEATARKISELGDLIVRELDEVIVALSVRDVLWVLGRMSVWYVRSCVLSTTCYRGSSFKRIGERVTLVAGLFYL